MNEQRVAFLKAISVAPPGDTLPVRVYADFLDEQGESDLAASIRLDLAAADVIAAPDDDAPRLEYAAICEGYGLTERAEFIRVQCELAAMGETPERKVMCGLVGEPSIRPEAKHLKGCRYCQWLRGNLFDRQAELLERERRLLAWMGKTYASIYRRFAFRPMPLHEHADPAVFFSRGFVDVARGQLHDFGFQECRRCAGYRRISTGEYDAADDHYVSMECHVCEGGGYEFVPTPLFREHPVRTLEVTDRTPYRNAASKYLWIRNPPGGTVEGIARLEDATLPRTLFDALKGHNEFEYRLHGGWKNYDTPNAAQCALVEAIIAAHRQGGTAWPS